MGADSNWDSNQIKTRLGSNALGLRYRQRSSSVNLDPIGKQLMNVRPSRARDARGHVIRGVMPPAALGTPLIAGGRRTGLTFNSLNSLSLEF